jgi:hypothetical protein
MDNTTDILARIELKKKGSLSFDWWVKQGAVRVMCD